MVLRGGINIAILTIYLKCHALQHILYIDICTQLMNFIAFPPFINFISHADVGNEMEVYREINSLFLHLWRVLPAGLILGTDSVTEQNGATLCICCHLMAAGCTVQRTCSFNVLLPYCYCNISITVIRKK